MLQGLSETKNMWTMKGVEKYAQKQAERALYISYLAAASTCTITLNNVTNHFGAKQNLNEFWEQLNKISLLSRAVWNLYAKKVL